MNIIINHSFMVPIYEQIVDQIKTLIRNGELKENDVLPSVRTLSKELKISALTVKGIRYFRNRRIHRNHSWQGNLYCICQYRTFT